jgi:chemotaxis protein methyltransferase CheR
MGIAEHENDPDFASFISNIYKSTGIDLSQYKETQMKRRLTTLRERRGHDTFASFYQALMKDKTLMAEFLDRMTINVSEFWRNPNRWEVLEKKLLPQLLAANRRLKCWSAACSTGEEPYSLAMILAKLGVLNDAKILATDLDENALAKAKLAVYQERSLRDVPQDYIRTYFKPAGESYTVVDELRRAISLTKGDLLADSFDSGFDLIICRNVMIYFTEEAKHKLYHKFAKALKPGGYLFVGSTEQIFTPSQYSLTPTEPFFYRKD